MTSPEDGQDDIGAYEFAVDDERDVGGAIVRITSDVNVKAKNLSGKAYRLRFTSPFKINIAENMAAEYSTKPDRGMTPDKTLAKREAVVKTYLSPLDRITTPGNGVVRVGDYMSPLSRGTSPDNRVAKVSSGKRKSPDSTKKSKK